MELGKFSQECGGGLVGLVFIVGGVDWGGEHEWCGGIGLGDGGRKVPGGGEVNNGRFVGLGG